MREFLIKGSSTFLGAATAYALSIIWHFTPDWVLVSIFAGLFILLLILTPSKEEDK